MRHHDETVPPPASFDRLGPSDPARPVVLSVPHAGRDYPDELIAGAGRLVERGVYPFVVPFRPMLGTLARQDGVPAPSAELVRYVTAGVAEILRAAEMTGAEQRAGCAACGACSALPAAGG